NLVQIEGVDYISVHPTFLYESLWNLGLLIIMLLMRKKKKFDGQIFFTYLVGYGLGRFWIEGIRTDQLKLWNTNIPVSQLLAAILVVLGTGLFVYNLKKND
ncbi:MAG: prolipoprotein diacylglyceryl transferase, partial [Pseudobutyrivibrio sp.]|nr:prolipoprotein diacylglyceryl transferase [Pseudobutyrivibrio sp.]